MGIGWQADSNMRTPSAQIFNVISHQAFKTVGDAFCVAIHAAPDALEAAPAAQWKLLSEPWKITGPLRVRMAPHTGSADERARIWEMRSSFSEGTGWLEAVLQQSGHTDVPARAKALTEASTNEQPSPTERLWRFTGSWGTSVVSPSRSTTWGFRNPRRATMRMRPRS